MELTPELIRLNETQINNEIVKTINARDLHEFLEVKSRYNDWIRNRINKYGFLENQDFVCLSKSLATVTDDGRQGSSIMTEHFLTLDIAKHLAIIENNDKGREARQHFIECERKQAKALKALSEITYQHPEGLIFSLAGEVYTTSQVLAEVSGRNHYHVLRDIRNEVAELKANQNLDASIKERILGGFKEITYKDSKGELRVAYQLSEEAFLQLKHPSEVRARFVVAFVSYRDALLDMYKARVLEKVIPQVSTSRSFIYIIREEGKGRLKIGISNNPENRLKTLQTGSAEDLTLLYTSLVCSNAMDIEANVHEHFKDYHVRGEWFREDLSLIDIIRYLESQSYTLSSDLDLSFDSKLIALIRN